MSIVMEIPARGKVTQVADGGVVFEPAGTNYQMHLKTSAAYTGPVGVLVDGFVRLDGRKVFTTPAGGRFVQPIFGTPRVVQGRIRAATDDSLLLQVGTAVVLKLPASDDAYDLSAGPLAVGAIVNATVLPGASFELVGVVKSE